MKKITIILLSTIFICVGCVSIRSVNEKVMKIEKGMSKAQVTNIMGGTPDNRSIDRNNEEWEYVYPYTQEENKVVIIRFKNEKVSGLDTFQRRIPHYQKPK